MNDAPIARPVRSLTAVTNQLLHRGSPYEVEVVEIDGVPTRVWRNADPTLRASLEKMRSYGDAPALVYAEERLSHAEFYRHAATMAHRMAGEYGIAKGDRVALALRNYPEWVIAYYAAAALGAVLVPLNAWWTGSELEYGLSDSGASLLVADEERIAALGGVPRRLDLPVIAVRTSGALPEGVRAWPDVLGEVAEDVRLPEADPAPDEPANIFYTSGTTGRPKGAVGSHRNMISNQLSADYARMRSLMRLGLDMGDAQAFLDAVSSPVVLCVVPLFHTTGAQSVMHPTLAKGGALVLMYKWSPEEALRLIERERVAAITAVPAMIAQMLASPKLGEHDLSSLLVLASGGAPAPPALVSRARAGMHDLMLAQGYGLTESSATATVNGGSDYLLRPDSAGLPVAVVDVKIVGAGGEELPPGEVGEVWINGPGIVHGYWNRPDATAASFTDGWLHTGDLGRLDEEGFLYIVDRAKDMIIRGGENVYCAEVEAAVHEHPAVAEVAVMGVPHEVYGEEVGAVVRALPGTSLTEEELRAFLADRLAAFKIPAHIRIAEGELPRNAAGKLLKNRLKRDHGWLEEAGDAPAAG
ncbi:class I adenylate-forming enzyme family protein [Nocardiopsis composta]|uniref:Long-chain acyl-CoA synthetase n=1 Tax=Nocardiopsis composta TaxID=157465 RepID=A0A7W8QKJ7_9ACTN|nr:AMP-binding protein [Nocardiopsis composta]MBB5431508.1 long-chain acyl-CoA synthetase [Nocardiopsis composta]